MSIKNSIDKLNKKMTGVDVTASAGISDAINKLTNNYTPPQPSGSDDVYFFKVTSSGQNHNIDTTEKDLNTITTEILTALNDGKNVVCKWYKNYPSDTSKMLAHPVLLTADCIHKHYMSGQITELFFSGVVLDVADSGQSDFVFYIMSISFVYDEGTAKISINDINGEKYFQMLNESIDGLANDISSLDERVTALENAQ